MSYILDALRKADAQRERDASRGIHAQAASIGPASRAAEPGSRMGCFALAAAGVVLAIGAGWYVMRSEHERVPVAASPAPVVVQAPPPATVITPAPPPPVVVPVAPPPAAAPTAPAAPATQVAASATTPAPIAGGLPPDAPRVAISGGVYSPNAAQRMLIVNGQVFNEGSEVAPGVKVEAIQPRTAVLSFRGARYTVAY